MVRTSITTRCIPVLLLSVAAACASRGTTTNVTSEGVVARDTTVAAAVTPPDTTARRDTTVRTDTTTRRDTAVTPPVTPTPTPSDVVLTVVTSPTGDYVTGAGGRAIYVIETTDTAFACVGPCATDLEPVTGQVTIAAGTTTLQTSMLGTRTLPSGQQQVTYNGKPLFYSRTEMTGGEPKTQGSKSYGTVKPFAPNK